MSSNGSIDLVGRFTIPKVELVQWALARSIHARLGMTAKDLGDIAMEDFIEEAMVDVKAELDVQEINYSTWTAYTEVPNHIRVATIYGTIVIITARKLQSFKSRVVPMMGNIRFEVIERDSMKAINYFTKKRDDAIEAYVAAASEGGSYMSSSTIDEDPIFDMDDLQDKAAGVGVSETSWHTWLRGVGRTV